MCKKLKTASQILGCPMWTTVKKKDAVPKALKKFGIKRVILEKSKLFCIYKPKVNPINIASILAGMNVKIEYVDFSQGLESAIRQTAMLVDREGRADELIASYKKNLSKAKALLPDSKLDKKVLILSGTYQHSSGKLMLRVEAPGGYADRFLLDPLGCVNVGDSFKPAEGKPQKGHYPVKKKKGGFVLDPLIKANPDVIVMTGNAFAAQKALAAYMKNNPALANVEALKNQAIYSLPFYIDSSVIEYPNILRQWTKALTD
jgi:ABC-type Fe3+-hydroxamate transport system substrate-binding protein